MMSDYAAAEPTTNKAPELPARGNGATSATATTTTTTTAAAEAAAEAAAVGGGAGKAVPVPAPQVGEGEQQQQEQEQPAVRVRSEFGSGCGADDPVPLPERPLSAKQLVSERLHGRALRVFSGTWNVRGRPTAMSDGTFEHIAPEAVLPWLRGAFPDLASEAGDGGSSRTAAEAAAAAQRPDLLFFALQEVMDLSPVNVVVDSFQPSEDHFARVDTWRNAIAAALDIAVPPEQEEEEEEGEGGGGSSSSSGSGSNGSSSKSSDKSSVYSWLGQSTQVGLVLLVFGTRAVRDSLREVQRAQIKTGWGGMLGNKGSCVWRARIGVDGPTVCAVASHFASGREKVADRNTCYRMAVEAKVFEPTGPARGAGKASSSSSARPMSLPAGSSGFESRDSSQRDSSSSRAGSFGSALGGFFSNAAANAAHVGSSMGSMVEGYLFGDDAHGSGVEAGFRRMPGTANTNGAGILDHDLVVWAGDLNYALHDEVSPIAAREEFTHGPGGGDATGGEAGAGGTGVERGLGAMAICEPIQTQLVAADQLVAERSAGRAFSGFDEAPLRFRPTYRVIVGEDAYDPKRCPAWTDRVMWRQRKAEPAAAAAAIAATRKFHAGGGDGGGGGGGGGDGSGGERGEGGGGEGTTIRGSTGSFREKAKRRLTNGTVLRPLATGSAVACVAYSCRWEARLSDHKPVFAVLDVDVEGLLTNSTAATGIFYL